MVVNTNQCEFFSGSTFIVTPKYIADKNAVINVQNTDNECFKWAVLSALHPAETNAQRVSKYKKFEGELNLSGIEYPVSLDQLTKFEKQNIEISINVYIIEENFNSDGEYIEKKIVPVRLTTAIKEKHIHLLLLTMKEKCDDVYTEWHYCWIKNLSRLIRSDCTKHESKIFICDRCLCYFISVEKLNEHILECAEKNTSKILMPDYKTKYLTFDKIQNQLECSYIIYADIECLLEAVQAASEATPKGAYQKHIPYSIGLYFHSRLDNDAPFYKSQKWKKLHKLVYE